MKKTLVALAVAALAATSANAATVYEKDGTKLDIGGSVRILLDKSTGDRTNLGNDGSRVNFSAKQDLGNGLSAVGYLRLKIDGDDASKLSVNKLYAGFEHEGVGAVTFGNQSTTGDDVALGDYTYKWGGNSPLTGSGKKVVKFRSAEFSGFSFGADYLFGNKEKNGAGLQHGYGLSAFYTAKFADDVTLNVNAGYTAQKDVLDVTKARAEFTKKYGEADDINDLIDAVKILSNRSNSWLLASEVNAGPVSFGLSYGQAKIKLADQVAQSAKAEGIATDGKLKVKAFLLGANYNITEVAKVYAQYNRTSAEDGHLNGYILGGAYKLHKNVETFVEVARFKTSGDKANNKLGVGFRVNF